MAELKKYRKFIVAAIGAIATAISTAAVPQSWRVVAACVVSVLTALGVYGIPNAQ